MSSVYTPSLKLGLLGGTFDPPHVGHLWLGETAREQLGLDEVLFLPVGEPPHKQGKSVSAVFHRLAMTQLAIANNPRFALDTTDIDRPPPHSTVSLIPHLCACYPSAQLWLLIGSDSLRDFPTWHDPHLLIQRCRLAVLPRPGVVIDWQKLETAVPGITASVDMLGGPMVAISSTEVRQWIGNGRSLRYLVPPEVLAYIRTNGLYCEA